MEAKTDSAMASEDVPAAAAYCDMETTNKITAKNINIKEADLLISKMEKLL